MPLNLPQFIVERVTVLEKHDELERSLSSQLTACETEKREKKLKEEERLQRKKKRSTSSSASLRGTHHRSRVGAVATAHHPHRTCHPGTERPCEVVWARSLLVCASMLIITNLITRVPENLPQRSRGHLESGLQYVITVILAFNANFSTLIIFMSTAYDSVKSMFAPPPLSRAVVTTNSKYFWSKPGAYAQAQACMRIASCMAAKQRLKTWFSVV